MTVNNHTERATRPRVLRLAGHGSVLATRAAGREAATAAISEISENPIVILDFDDVMAVTAPFADELVKAVHGALAGNDEGKIVLVCGMDEDARETLEMVLDRRRLLLTAIDDDSLRLLGGPAHLQETLDAARRLGRFTAPQLASELKIELNNTNHRLAALVAAGALARARDTTAIRGMRYAFSAPVLEAARHPKPSGSRRSRGKNHSQRHNTSRA